MKETIVGALIIGGLIGGAILLTSQKTHNPIHQITAAKDMVWMSDDLHTKHQDGNKHVVIKKIAPPIKPPIIKAPTIVSFIVTS